MASGLVTPPPRRGVGRTLGILAVALILGASSARAASLVATSTTAFGIESASRFQAHWVSQRYWVALHNGTTAVLYSSPDAVTWTSQGAIFSSFNPPANQGDWAVRYDGARIIAVGFSVNTRYYRNGTLNADGTVTWNAADAVAQAGASSTPLNAVVANQRPVYWRSTAAGTGQLARGTQLNGPTWGNLPVPPAALATITGGGFSAAALFATGGPDPDDLILLRATTQAGYVLGNHRLVSIKFDSSLNAHDGAWYNVSTLNGGLGEGAATEVKPGTDGEAHQRFAAVRDTGGDIHAVYVNRNNDVVHYRKTVGFNDGWSRVSTDVTVSAAVIDRVALSALAGGQLTLFYSKSDAGIYYRLWSGSAWSGESTLQAASATPLQGALTASELADGCSVGLAWTERAVSPFDVRFQAVPVACGGLRVKSGTYTGSGLVRSISGVGFQPDVVIIDGVNGGAANSVIRTSTMANPNSKEMDVPTALAGGQITSLDADGFSLGIDADVNENTRDYYWVAFKGAAPGAMKVGTYAGAAVAQDVTGVGFSPDYVIVMSPNAAETMQRSVLMPPGFCVNFAGAGYSDSILDTLPDGFRVGADSSVAGAGVTFHYVAWNATPGQIAVGRYPGDKADGRNITGAGFQPEYVIVDRSNDVGGPTGTSVGNAPAHKMAASGVNTDSTLLFNGNVAETDNIQALQADGFQLGTHCRVNGDGTCNVPVPVAYYWMAFGPHIPRINLRSIGVAANFAGAALDGIVVTLGSTNVTKSVGLGWKAQNRGRGDVLTVGANSYVIAAVNTDNQLTLATPAVANYAALAYTIARQFRGGGVSNTAIDNWEDCVDGPPGTACPAVAPVTSASLVADDRREIGIIYDDASPAILLTSTLQIQDSTTDATHDIRLTADPGNRHNGVAGAGVVIDANLGGNELDIRDSNVTVEWLEFVKARGDNIAAIQVYGIDGDVSTNVVLQNLLIHDFGDKLAAAPNSSGIDLAGSNTLVGKSLTVRNTMIWDGDQYAIEGDGILDTALIENVSIDGMTVRGVYAASGPFTVRNTIVTSSPGGDFATGGTGSLSGSNNTSTDASASFGANSQTGATAAAVYVTPNVNLHLKAGANVALDAGLDLSSGFSFDIDGQLRPAGLAWDRGADERDATTEVELQSFAAVPGDATVVLEWRTASELRNLGFHLYRGLAESGPWTRLTSSLIAGLGSSAVGQAYSFRDTGLVNGTRYFYRLEDVDASSKVTSHGPVSAVPLVGAPGGAPGREPPGGSPSAKAKGAGTQSCPEWVVAAYRSTVGSASASFVCKRHGDPEAVSLGVLSRDSRSATIELRTGGFYALSEASGRVRVFVPGFDFPQDPQAPALPFRRALIEAVVGRRVQLGGVRALDRAAFPGLVPAALGGAEMQVSRDGTVRAGRRSLRELTPQHVSSELARLLPSVFQAETKSAVVALTPLRYDARRRQIVLAKRLLVRLLFTGRETGESGRGSSGRKQRPEKPAAGELLARVYTTSRGLHALRFEQVFPGGGRGVAASELRLERQGQAQAFHLEPASGTFGPGSVVYFHADAAPASTDFSSELAWELLRARDGVRMPLVSAAPLGEAVTSASAGQASFESDRFYQPGLLDAPDLWLWEGLVSGATRTKSFTLAGVNMASSQAAELEVFLQGASESGRDVDHHVSVSLGGVLVGEAQFAGKRPYRMSLSVPPALLHEGANELSLANVADTGVSSLVFLDRFTVSFPQTSSLTSGVFQGTWGESGTATVSGAVVALLDVTAASASGGTGGSRWLTDYEATAGSLRFRAEAGHRYLAVSPQGLLTPRVAAPTASSLRATTNQADYLLIAPRAFLAAAEPLLERRRDQGLQARAVAFEEIADAFGHGQPSAEAIRSFLAFAFQSWTRPSPRYVLLLGDSNYDPRNFTGTAAPSPLPALWTKTSYLWTVSDPLLAAVNGEDALPDLAIGRLPTATVEEAQRLVAKLVAWEDSGQGLSGAAALVADNPDLGGDFETDVRDIAQSFLADKDPQLLLLSELGAGARPAIQAALDAGLGLLSYVGHGGAAVWASENVWNSWDAASLQAQSRQPLLLTLNCLNGYFVAPAFDSLTESLLKADGRGAIAGFSPSGLSLDGPAHQYHRALMAEITSRRHERLGDALAAAQKTYAQAGLMPELLSVYHLLGDPAMSIH